MRSVCEPIFEKPLKDISFGYLLVQLFHTAGRFNMEVQPSLVLLQKTLLNVEGLGRQLYPELDLWQTGKPYLENWMKQRLGPKAIWQEIRRQVPFWLKQGPGLPAMLDEGLKQIGQLPVHQQQIGLKLDALSRSLEDNSRKQKARIIGLIISATGLCSLLTPFLWSPQISFGIVAAGLLWIALRG